MLGLGVGLWLGLGLGQECYTGLLCSVIHEFLVKFGFRLNEFIQTEPFPENSQTFEKFKSSLVLNWEKAAGRHRLSPPT